MQCLEALLQLFLHQQLEYLLSSNWVSSASASQLPRAAARNLRGSEPCSYLWDDPGTAINKKIETCLTPFQDAICFSSGPPPRVLGSPLWPPEKLPHGFITLEKIICSRPVAWSSRPVQELYFNVALKYIYPSIRYVYHLYLYNIAGGLSWRLFAAVIGQEVQDWRPLTGCQSIETHMMTRDKVNLY